MNAAQPLFLKLGVGPTTIEQITAAADVAKGTFYLHFASKEAVLTALRVRYVREFQARIEDAIKKCPPEDWDAKLAAWAEAAVTAYLDSVPVHDLVFHEFETDGSHPDIVVEYLTSMLEEGARAAVWSVEEPRLTAVFLFHGLHGVVDEALATRQPVKRRRLIQSLQDSAKALTHAIRRG
jgi:AcrR family transcriptional regulator